MWFVYSIILNYIFFFLVNRIIPNVRIATFVILLLQLLYIYMARGEWELGWKWWASALGFNVGMYLCLYERSFCLILRKRASLFALPMLMAAAVIAIYAAGHFGMSELAFCMGWPLLTFLLIHVCGVADWRVIKIFGKYSYEIYLVHGYLMCFYMIWPYRSFVGNMTFALSIYGVTFLLSLILKCTSTRLCRIL